MRVRFWVKSGLYNSGVLLACSAVYTVMMHLNTEAISLSEMILFLPVYLWIFGSFMSIAFASSLYKQSLPLALSFGSTRKEAIFGIQLYRLIPMVVMAAVSPMLTLLCGRESFQIMVTVLPGACGGYLIVNSIGSMIGIITAKFGNKALLVTVPVIILLFVGGFFLGVTAITGFDFLCDLVLSPTIVWIALAAGAVVYAVSLIPEVKTVRSYNVKL